MKTFESAVQTEVDATKNAPVNFLEMYLDAGTLRYAATRSDVVFPTGGNTFSAISFTSSGRKVSRKKQLVYMDYQIDDRDKTLRTYNAAEKFKGKRFVAKRVFRNAFGAAANYNEIINGYMDEPNFDKEWMYLKVIDGKKLGQRARNSYYQRPCNNEPGGARCNYDGYFDLTSLTATGTADSGDTDYFIDNALTQVDDYWNFGRAEITVGGIIYYRDIIDFDAATDKVTIDPALPVAISNGDAYTIYKGCSLTWEACQGLEAWGPSADNSANFIGNIHLLKQEDDEFTKHSGFYHK